MDIASLHEAYRAGCSTPLREVERYLMQRSEKLYASVLISHLDETELRQRASVMTDALRADPDILTRQALFGVLYVAKDNIDVAGLPTTAACPAFSYLPPVSATVIQRLDDAGAICVGKANMDQFATGLVGTRSPYGEVPNALLPELISGGSSAGSAVAVARGWVSFALGTDTAGSGRVPAALNNIVGLKPSRGLISAHGVVPACQSIDCVSIFTLTVGDAVRVFEVARAPDPMDPFSRPLPLVPDVFGERFQFGIPIEGQREFFGDSSAASAFEQACERLRFMGGEPVPIPFDVFQEAAALLYEGPWVAERLAAVGDFLRSHHQDVNAVVRGIINGGGNFSAATLFTAQTRLAALKKKADELLDRIDVLVLPTVPTVYSRAQVAVDPVATNRRLGYYTNFVNLLDLAALAVPCVFRQDGVPAGVTLVHRAGTDLMLARLGDRLHRALATRWGATDFACAAHAWHAMGDNVDVVVVGAHLDGQPLNHQLRERGARLLLRTQTAPRYRLFALSGTQPPKPGLARVAGEHGKAIEVEVWRMPVARFGDFTAMIPAPLCMGSIELADGTWRQGFLCEHHALDGADDITRFGGWRAYRQASREKT